MEDDVANLRGTDSGDTRARSEAEAQTLRFLTQRWAVEIITLPSAGPARYKDLRQSILRVHDRMLSKRLDTLIDEGLVVRTQSAGKPITVTDSLAASEAEGLTAIVLAVCAYAKRA